MLLWLPVVNLLAGRGWIPLDRFLFRMVAMPALVAWHVEAGQILSVFIFACFALWAIPGHGKYFSSFHGEDNPNEAEIGWIDRLGYKLYPMGDNYARGRFCMGLRGMYLYPLFMALAFVAPYAPLIGLGMFMQGWCYGICRHAPDKYAVPIAEFNTGALIAILVGAL